MRTKVYEFFDFDGSLIDSPLPEYGKEMWKEVKGTEYPHLGWWGRPESLDLNVFDIKANPVVKQALLEAVEKKHHRYILTSRILRLEKEVKAVLAHNGLDGVFDGFSFFSPRDKGQRILDMISGHEDLVSEIKVYEDREKEFIALEIARPIIEKHGIKFTVIKVDIDHDFGRK